MNVAVSTYWRDIAAVHEASATAAYEHIFDRPFPREEAAVRWRGYVGSVALAVQDETPIGFAAWSEHMLDALYVLPQSSGQGVWKRLLQRLPDEARELWVLVGNGRGRRFYERHGWVSTGIVRTAYEPIEEILYRR